jgi:hypothetical protein
MAEAVGVCRARYVLYYVTLVDHNKTLSSRNVRSKIIRNTSDIKILVRDNVLVDIS